MGLLGDVYSYGDGLKRKLRGLLDDPLGTLEQGVRNFGEDQNGLLNLAENAYPMPGNRTVLNSPEQIAGFRKELAGKGAEQAMAAATVWHGSPHKFDKFDASKIGTGEGAQAYGHGLYLAESPDVAKSYGLAGTGAQQFKSVSYGGAEYGADAMRARTLHDVAKQGRRPVIQRLESEAERLANYAPDQAALIRSELEFAKTVNPDKVQINGGNHYKVDLPDEHISRMLDWDKPLSQQAPEVIGNAVNALKAQKVRQADIDWLMNKPAAQMEQYLMRSGNRAEAAQNMKQAGIPGIRYLDGGSRGAGQGSSNYVVFPGNEGLLSILERNGAALK